MIQRETLYRKYQLYWFLDNAENPVYFYYYYFFSIILFLFVTFINVIIFQMSCFISVVDLRAVDDDISYFVGVRLSAKVNRQNRWMSGDAERLWIRIFRGMIGVWAFLLKRNFLHSGRLLCVICYLRFVNSRFVYNASQSVTRTPNWVKAFYLFSCCV